MLVVHTVTIFFIGRKVFNNIFYVNVNIACGTHASKLNCQSTMTHSNSYP